MCIGMSRRPTVAWILSLIGGLVILILASEISVGNLLFFASIISGLIILASTLMLFLKPENHLLWGIIVIVVAIVDLVGALYFLYSPIPQGQATTLIATLGPIIALVGGTAGLVWRPTGVSLKTSALKQ